MKSIIKSTLNSLSIQVMRNAIIITFLLSTLLTFARSISNTNVNGSKKMLRFAESVSSCPAGRACQQSAYISELAETSRSPGCPRHQTCQLIPVRSELAERVLSCPKGTACQFSFEIEGLAETSRSNACPRHQTCQPTQARGEF
jgi:hypothetical protein